MDSQTLVNKYEARLEGQQLLWEDHDIVLRNNLFKPVDPDFDREALVHWWMNVYTPNGHGEQDVPQPVFSSWSNAMWGRFKYVMVSGYWPDTNQSAIKLACVKKSPIEPQVAELKMWLPHIKEDENRCGSLYEYRTTDERKGKRISIFESTLSKHGSYDLIVYSDTEYVIGKHSYGWREVLEQFDTLEATVGYICKNLWYKKRENE